MTLHPDTLAISTGRPPAVPDGPLNVPIAPAAALHPGGASHTTSRRIRLDNRATRSVTADL